MKNVIMPFVCGLLVASASAHGYYDTPYNFVQPDGDTVAVRLFGSDLYIDAESVDGYTLISDSDNGYICYALLSADGDEYASSGIKYYGGEAPQAVKIIAEPHLRLPQDIVEKKRNEARAKLGREEISAPKLRASDVMPDTVYGLCVLIDFPDEKFPFSIPEIEKYMNGVGSINGNEMSIKEYFQWVSGGKLTYINYVPKSPYTAPNKKSYYAPVDATDYTVDRLRPVIESAMNSYSKKTDGFDLSDLSMKNGVYWAVNIYYAGACPNKWATGLWAHSGTLTFSLNDSRLYSRSVKQKYQMSYMSSDLSMNTFVHESLHLLLGAPDFYSFDNHDDNNAKKYNVADEFTLSRKKMPPFLNPYIMDAAGWITNKVVLNDLKEGTKVTLEHGPGNVAVYYGDGNSRKERYYIEIRDSHYGSGWATTGKPGFYIWHANDDGDNRYAGKPEMLDCRPASKSNPFWSSDSPSKVFSDSSDPSATWASGEKSGLLLTDFSASSYEMSFCYGECDPEEQGGQTGPETMVELSVTKGSLPVGKVGEKYYAKLEPSGGDGNYSIKWKDGLPQGLSLNSKWEISGVPTVAVKKNLKFVLSDGSGASKEIWKSIEITGDSSDLDDIGSDFSFVVGSVSDGFEIVSKSDDMDCSVYSVSGVLVDRFAVLSGETVHFGSDYSKGIYIVDADGVRFKIVKK